MSTLQTNTAEAPVKMEGRPEQAEKPRAPRKEAPPPVPKEAYQEMQAPGKLPWISSFIFTVIIAVAVYAGWAASKEKFIAADEGIGYYLGIAGALMMLSLILYPLRKSLKSMRRWGAIKHWFRAHMILGILGPVLVLLHSNYSLGSMNSAIAITVTMTVAISGIIGRYFYTRIHFGLYGRKASLEELRSSFESEGTTLQEVFSTNPALKAKVVSFGDSVLKAKGGFFGSLFNFATVGFRAASARFALGGGLKQAIDAAAARSGWTEARKKEEARSARKLISKHISTAVKASRFKVYERLFSLWHVLHMPLFLFLVIVVIIHVIAVHMY